MGKDPWGFSNQTGLEYLNIDYNQVSIKEKKNSAIFGDRRIIKGASLKAGVKRMLLQLLQPTKKNEFGLKFKPIPN